ncbi:unnamed protein product [Blepharisma stoltei]|uniref:serine--tRNA ligase n=1 Tax=Blepharisma stoltei TaxID=1481888 RepID=A0AAU9JCR9_9CILI|nr:unnamed protein product [Blepharisma stoltei]
MPIDLNRLRTERGGDPNEVRNSQIARFKDAGLVDRVIELDQEWRRARFNLEQLNKEFGQLNKAVAERKKANKEDPCTEENAKKEELDKLIEEAKVKDQELLNAVNEANNLIGNIIHPSVPISETEDDNRVERTWGEPNAMVIDNTPGHYFHHAVLSRLDGYDSERGVKLVGHRGYLLKGNGLLLNQALINYGLNFLTQRQYTLIQPPFFMNRSMMARTAELADFHDQLYKVTGEEGEEGFYLIATSEQPISCMHHKEWLPEKSLPLRYGGYSSCFRREAGAHGKDTWGIFRIHQFEKVEQFCITTPEKSWEMHEEMIATCEEFYRSLNLPYRVIAIVSKELNLAAAKKYDLEAWFPGYKTYRELVSCSNCTDYQSRAVEVRCGAKKQNETEKRYVHMLNATLCATERTLCCILENYQTADGLVVPEVLRPYIGGREFLPWVRELTKEELKKF